MSGEPRLLLVGAGKMGGALLRAWLKQGIEASSIAVLDPAVPEATAALFKARGVRLLSAPNASLQPAIIVLAVKPQLIPNVLPTLVPLIANETVVLSVAAGKRLGALAALLPKGTAIVRTMPNTPAAIGEGVSVLVANAAATKVQREICEKVLAAAGAVFWLHDERLMDAVTAVSGSGPAYVFLLAECLAEAGVELGLPQALSAELAKLTVAGAAALMRQADETPAELRENVTSPNGTTAAALGVLMGKDGLKELLARAVVAAAARAKELSS